MAPGTLQERTPISLGGMSALQPSKPSALQPPSLFQNQGFSTPPLLLFIIFIKVYDPISLSALGDHVYQYGPIPEHDRLTRGHLRVRCSKIRDVDTEKSARKLRAY